MVIFILGAKLLGLDLSMMMHRGRNHAEGPEWARNSPTTGFDDSTDYKLLRTIGDQSGPTTTNDCILARNSLSPAVTCTAASYSLQSIQNYTP